MNTGEILTKVMLQFWNPQIKAGVGVGSEVQHYTIKLTNARIVDIKQEMSNMSYEKIEWIGNDGGIAATDSWK